MQQSAGPFRWALCPAPANLLDGLLAKNHPFHIPCLARFLCWVAVFRVVVFFDSVLVFLPNDRLSQTSCVWHRCEKCSLRFRSKRQVHPIPAADAYATNLNARRNASQIFGDSPCGLLLDLRIGSLELYSLLIAIVVFEVF